MSETSPQFQSILETSFQVESVTRVPAPSGTVGDWYRYVITQGQNADNAITGTRCGTLGEINSQLAEMVERLNERCGKLAAKKKTR